MDFEYLDINRFMGDFSLILAYQDGELSFSDDLGRIDRKFDLDKPRLLHSVSSTTQYPIVRTVKDRFGRQSNYKNVGSFVVEQGKFGSNQTYEAWSLLLKERLDLGDGNRIPPSLTQGWVAHIDGEFKKDRKNIQYGCFLSPRVNLNDLILIFFLRG